MSEMDLLEGKRILIVDDEPDVLETLGEILSNCDVTKALKFDEGMKMLEEKVFDIAILDIMGVDGFKLLEEARKRQVIPVMLTANALSPENIIRSYHEGAASYVPKDEMGNIKVFLYDILEAKQRGKSTWWRWFDRLAGVWEKKFGPDWKKKDKEFWEKFPTL